jgi:hypothetical protein
MKPSPNQESIYCIEINLGGHTVVCGSFLRYQDRYVYTQPGELRRDDGFLSPLLQ